MYVNYIDKFEWFLRADDDVFIKPDKLEKFLRRVDSTRKQFIGEIKEIKFFNYVTCFIKISIGQAGRGNSEEIDKLWLESDENFCMGGPGIIMSRETLKKGIHSKFCELKYF